jgi:hypothetical protein
MTATASPSLLHVLEAREEGREVARDWCRRGGAGGVRVGALQMACLFVLQGKRERDVKNLGNLVR